MIWKCVRITDESSPLQKRKIHLSAMYIGFQTTPTYYHYMTDYVLPQVIQMRPDENQSDIHIFLPVDEHTSHSFLQILKYCFDNNIIAFCIPSYSSHITQPLDKPITAWIPISVFIKLESLLEQFDPVFY